MHAEEIHTVISFVQKGSKLAHIGVLILPRAWRHGAAGECLPTPVHLCPCDIYTASLLVSHHKE